MADLGSAISPPLAYSVSESVLLILMTGEMTSWKLPGKPMAVRPQALSMLMSLGDERVPLVVVVEDHGDLSASILPICDYLSVAVKRVDSGG